ncbi:uncharacterized protein K02A2.6-like [Morus notabilis]|uniref:uncharacterized protein K02A2.6-like n=1 Tax=Morus notabilis TaxID=981085 RepID=UPI000CED5111|nr:uncharacterized protein K02A2.6-like [Morus notabilis]
MFGILRKYRMKLNPQKCAFGVGSGKFLGFMVSNRRIEANPEKIKALQDMRSPTKPKEVQRLTGCVATLNRFISKATDKCVPFFDALRGNKHFEWTPQCEEAFQKLKEHLDKPPILSKPNNDEELSLYISVSQHAVSSVLIKEEGKVQLPIYYVSKRLLVAESRYSEMERLAIALMIASRKLRHYFQSHTIRVLTNHPLRQALQKPETSGRLLKWSVELSQFDIKYMPRTAIKGQALADFLAEFSHRPTYTPSEETEIARWKLYVDGAPWPFAKWGIDLIGPLHPAPGGLKFAIVAVDYYTKWAEAKALTTTTEAACTKFMWDHIVCRFGVPHSIVSDNGKQFDNAATRRFCDGLGIRKDFSAPIHPQSNGQVEAINKILKYTLKKRLDDLKGRWAEELSKVLWAYRTTSRTTTGETPFLHGYGVETVLPVEIETPTLRTVVHNDEDNAEGMNGELDLLEEKRLNSQLRLVAYQQRTARYYNKKVRQRRFTPGDLVLKRVTQSTKPKNTGPLGLTWEGPLSHKESTTTWHLRIRKPRRQKGSTPVEC